MRSRWILSIASRPMAKSVASASAESKSVSRLWRLGFGLGLAGIAASLGGCASNQSVQTASRSKEYFPSSVYGTASPRVVADGDSVPRGGGNYMIGKPYTVAGKTYYPSERVASQVGNSSWYGAAFHGRRTANGEVFDRNSISAAHPTMPLPSYARVTNLRNNHSIVVRVNDRGPFHGGRVMDVSQRVAELLDFKHHGTGRVKIEALGKAGLGGSDDKKLMASLRQDGTPATLDGYGGGNNSVMLAQQPAKQEPVRTAALARPQVQQQDDDADATPVVRTGTPVAQAEAPSNALSFAGAAPRPPSRPFDLGTIPGAGTPIAAAKSKVSSVR